MTIAIEKIKVVHLITRLEMGGAQGNTIYTVHHLNPGKYDTFLWAGQGAYWDKDVEKTLQADGKLQFFRRLIRPVHPLWDLVTLFELVRALKRLNPTILHTHSSKAGILGRLAGHWAGTPVIVHTFHGFGFHPRQNIFVRSLFLFLERWTARMAHKLIFVSESNRKSAAELKIGDPSQYALIRSGVPLEILRKAAFSSRNRDIRWQLRIPDKSPIVTTIGPFKPQKNLGDFLRVSRELLKFRNDIHFLLIGDGVLRGELEEMVLDFHIQNNVHLPGWRRDVPQILAITDVFVMTSLWEGLPRALVEAMALGIPPVCYRTDGIQDIIGKSEGILVEQGDTQSMIASIYKLLNDSSHWSNVSRNTKQAIGPEFDIDTMVHQQETIYEELL